MTDTQARFWLETYAECCADTQAELNDVLDSVAEDYDNARAYVRVFLREIDGAPLDDDGDPVMWAIREAADDAIGDVIAACKR